MTKIPFSKDEWEAFVKFKPKPAKPTPDYRKPMLFVTRRYVVKRECKSNVYGQVSLGSLPKWMIGKQVYIAILYPCDLGSRLIARMLQDAKYRLRLNMVVVEK